MLQSGNDLQIDVMGTNDHVTVSGWYGAAQARLQPVVTAASMPAPLSLDSQLNNLVAAMATFATGHPGFDPTAPANPQVTDPNLLALIAADWHR